MRDLFDPSPEEQIVVLVERATIRKAERLVESCERNPEAEIPFDWILDRITGSDSAVTDLPPHGNPGSPILRSETHNQSRRAGAMFCPQCRAEYREGFFRCSDCDIPLVDQLPPDRTDRQPGLETDHPELVVLRTFPTVIEADLAKSALESVGIDAMVRSDNKGGESLAFSRGVGVLVRAEDVTAANDMLGIEGLDSSQKR